MSDLFPISPAEVVAELERELAMRERVYPRLVQQRKLDQHTADRRMQLMQIAIDIITAAAKE